MKINSITANTGYFKDRGIERQMSGGKPRAYERHNVKQNNNDQINTTIKMNSDGRVSFKGGVPFLHRAANFASENPLVAEALFAILITCGLRPLTIMATAKNEEDKEKCSYQAAKSVSSGLVGLGTTALIGMPVAAAAKKANQKGAFNMPPEMKEKSLAVVKEGVDALSGLAKKLTAEGRETGLVEQIKGLTDGGKINLSVFSKAGKGAKRAFTDTISEKAPEISDKVKKALTEQQMMNNYAKTGKNVIDKLFQPVFMPLRAMITIAMVPILLGLLGKKKPDSKPKEQTPTPMDIMNYNVFQNSSEKELFQSFAGVSNYENK